VFGVAASEPSSFLPTSPIASESAVIDWGGDSAAGTSETIVARVINVGTSPTRNDARSASFAVRTMRQGPPSAGTFRATGTSRFNRTPLGEIAQPG
jgi:hypothetical protein